MNISAFSLLFRDLDELNAGERRVNIQHECTELYIHESLTADLVYWHHLGFSVVKANIDSAWIQNGDIRFHLIPKSSEIYEVIVTATAAELHTLCDYYNAKMPGGVELVKDLDHVECFVLTHTDTQKIFMFAWRQEPIFKDLFD